MSEAYLGEIRLFAGSFAPTKHMICDGREISLYDYNALYQLIGTAYGGDGEMTFALPDLRGRVPVHQGQGVGLQNYPLASAGGAENIALDQRMIPPHKHVVFASSAPGTSSDPQPGADVLCALGPGAEPPVSAWMPAGEDPQLTLSPTSTSPAGANQPHSNVQPSLAVTYIICFDGILPPQP